MAAIHCDPPGFERIVLDCRQEDRQRCGAFCGGTISDRLAFNPLAFNSVAFFVARYLSRSLPL